MSIPYKLIALDLDDTLLNAKKEIPERNLRAVRRAKELGAHIVIASGRAYAGTTRFEDEMGVHDYIISTGGAVIADPDGHVIDRAVMPPETTYEIMRWAKDRGIYFQVYTDDRFMYETRTADTDRYERGNGYMGVHVPGLSERTDIASGKILFIGDADEVVRWQREVREAFPDLMVQTSEPIFLEMCSPDASKGNALKRLAEHLGIAREEVMAFGDSEIDRSMIEYAGMGVAVANARVPVLEAADYVAASCDNCGVADVIEEYVLGKAPA